MEKLIYVMGIVTSSIILLLGMALTEKYIAQDFRVWAGVIMSISHIVVIVCMVAGDNPETLKQWRVLKK